MLKCLVDMLQDCSALGLAVCGGHLAVAQCLLLAGANVTAKGPKYHVRPLFFLSFPLFWATLLLLLHETFRPDQETALTACHV